MCLGRFHFVNRQPSIYSTNSTYRHHLHARAIKSLYIVNGHLSWFLSIASPNLYPPIAMCEYGSLLCFYVWTNVRVRAEVLCGTASTIPNQDCYAAIESWVVDEATSTQSWTMVRAQQSECLKRKRRSTYCTTVLHRYRYSAILYEVDSYVSQSVVRPLLLKCGYVPTTN